METLVAICCGLGLAAACGLRVFVPLLVVAVGGRIGLAEVGSGFAWITTWPAIIALGSACALEVAGYLIPWIDHALDAAATPAAAVAGTLVAASQFGEMGPMLGWTTAAVAGGGLAGVVQAATVGTRAASTATTAGLAIPFLSALESALAAIMAVLAVLVPVLLGIVVVIWAAATVRWWMRRRAARRVRIAPAATASPALSLAA